MTGTNVQDESRRALFGWSPPDLPADTAVKRRADRLLPRTGWAAVLYCAVVIALLNVAPHLPERGNLALDGLAALAAAAWCGLNFWRCRHAHCIVTSTGWAALSLLAFTEAVLGHSLIGGNEQPVFLAVLAAAVVFEVGWRLARGSSAIGCGGGAGGPIGCGGAGGPIGCGAAAVRSGAGRGGGSRTDRRPGLVSGVRIPAHRLCQGTLTTYGRAEGGSGRATGQAGVEMSEAGVDMSEAGVG